MALTRRILVLFVILGTFVSKSWAQMLLDGIFGDVDSCEDVCERTFPLHTYEKAVHLGYCRRGCRLFTIIDFVDEYSNTNQTKSACADACGDAYASDDNKNACVLGCASQVPVVERRQQQWQSMEPQSPGSLLFPMMYVHNWYSNMVDKLSQQMSVSWSFFVQGDNGQMVVVRSEPKVLINNNGNWEEADYKTSNYIETNLAEVDNSATPNLDSSQVHSLKRDIEDPDASYAAAQGADWLTCIAKKTGLPRLLLAGTIFVSAFVMIWIILSAAVTAPEQRVMKQPQKLSINGDLEYLRELGDKPLLAAYTPQEASQNAPPLPIKIKIQRI